MLEKLTRNLRNQSAKNIFLFLVLCVCVISFQLGIHFLPRITELQMSGLDLSGTWDYCRHSDDISSGCDWKKTEFPGNITNLEGSKYVTLRKHFQTPSWCGSSENGCSFVVGIISDSARAFLNGLQIGELGSFEGRPIYTQTYPLKVYFPPQVLKKAGDNELLIQLKPRPRNVVGLIRGPIKVFPAVSATAVTELLLGEMIVLPLVSGLGLVALALIALGFLFRGKFENLRALRLYTFYVFTVGLYLVSLTKIPREHLSIEIGYGLHFGLRFLSEFFHLGLICSFLSFNNKMVKAGRSVYLIIAIGLLVPSLLLGVFGDSAIIREILSYNVWAYRKLIILANLTPIVAIYLSQKRKGEISTAKILTALYSLVLVMQFSDFLALNGFIEDIYFVSFYPLIIGLTFGYVLWTFESDRKYSRMLEADLSTVMAQVAHDIRSPLAALDKVTSILKEAPENKRVLIRSAVSRIRDIANILYEKSRPPEEVLPQTQALASLRLISHLIESVVSEKRVQYRSRMGIEIELDLDQDSYGAFSAVDSGEFKRVISNLIDNSVEAIKGKGQVTVQITQDQKNVQIMIADTGKGIPQSMLGRVGQKGFTHEKKGGQGLGLYHAREQIQKWGGSLDIKSTTGKGTTISIQLNRAEPPNWFVQKISIQPNTNVVVLDDDQTIHEIWKQRFDDLAQKGPYKGTLTHFVDGSRFVREMKKKAKNLSSTIFLVDYELLDQGKNGIERILELGIEHQATLVTSHFENPRIRDACRSSGIGLIPKGLAIYVPFEVGSLGQNILGLTSASEKKSRALEGSSL